MEIYIRTMSRDDGRTAWWNKTGVQSYLYDSKTIFAEAYGDTFLAGTPFHSVKEAKQEARKAKSLAEYDGYVDVEVTFWRFIRGKLVETKFTRDGKIKR